MGSISHSQPLEAYNRGMAPLIRAGNSLIVTLYKIAGFAVLLTILAGLVSYLSVHILFFLNSRWTTPVVLSASDEQVLRIESEISEQELARDRVLGERIQLTSTVQSLGRHRNMQQALQHRVEETIRGGRADRIRAADTLKSAITELASVAPNATSANTEYASNLQTSTDQLAKAHLLTQEEISARQHAMSQLAADSASLAEHNADLTNRLRVLQREGESLEAADGAGGIDPPPLTVSAMQLKAQKDNAYLLQTQDSETERELINRIDLENATLRRIDSLLASLYGSPYLTAALQGQALAFIPYSNLSNAWVGQTVYSCRLTVIWCKRAGRVLALLPGEVQGKDPISGKDERGRYVQLALAEMQTAQQRILYVGRRPLGF